MPGGSNFWPYGYGVTENPNGVTYKAPDSYGPYLPPAIESGEFAFIENIQRSVSSAVSNASRLLYSSNASPVKQGESSDTGPAWYNIPGRISGALGSVNDAFQSTLIKVIVLVSIIGIVAVFGMSYMQAKGANLAK